MKKKDKFSFGEFMTTVPVMGIFILWVIKMWGVIFEKEELSPLMAILMVVAALVIIAWVFKKLAERQDEEELKEKELDPVKKEQYEREFKRELLRASQTEGQRDDYFRIKFVKPRYEQIIKEESQRRAEVERSFADGDKIDYFKSKGRDGEKIIEMYGEPLKIWEAAVRYEAAGGKWQNIKDEETEQARILWHREKLVKELAGEREGLLGKRKAAGGQEQTQEEWLEYEKRVSERLDKFLEEGDRVKLYQALEWMEKLVAELDKIPAEKLFTHKGKVMRSVIPLLKEELRPDPEKDFAEWVHFILAGRWINQLVQEEKFEVQEQWQHGVDKTQFEHKAQAVTKKLQESTQKKLRELLGRKDV